MAEDKSYLVSIETKSSKGYIKKRNFIVHNPDTVFISTDNSFPLNSMTVRLLTEGQCKAIVKKEGAAVIKEDTPLVDVSDPDLLEKDFPGAEQAKRYLEKCFVPSISLANNGLLTQTTDLTKLT